MNKLGLSVHPWWINGNLRRLEKELEELQSAGADCCELVLHALDVVIGGRIIPARLEAVLKSLEKYNMEYTLHMPYDLNLLSQSAAELYMQVFRAGIAFAKAAGIGLIVYHAGRTRSLDTSVFDREAAQVKLLAKEAGDLLICMENPLFLRNDALCAGSTAQNMMDFCEKVNAPNFKLAFDIGHSFLHHRGDSNALLHDLRTLLPYIGHIHLHDNFGVSLMMSEYDYSHRIACGAADLHLPLGWGSIPMQEVLLQLRGYNGIINMEIEKRFHAQYSESISFVRPYAKANTQARGKKKPRSGTKHALHGS